MKTDLKITEEQKRKYKENGFFILESVIPDDELVIVRKECGELNY